MCVLTATQTIAKVLTCCDPRVVGKGSFRVAKLTPLRRSRHGSK